MENRDTRFDRMIRWAWRRLANEDGISMMAAIGALAVGMLLSASAWAATTSGIRISGTDRYSKLAYQRAQSGIADYVKRLANDPNVWAACDRGGIGTGNGLGQSAINDTLYGTAYDAAYGTTDGHPFRRWLPYQQPGTAADLAQTGQYTIDLLPANNASCGTTNVATAADRMINSLTGTFRIRVTGRAGPPVPASVIAGASTDAAINAKIDTWKLKNWKKVSIISEFRRAGFLDYVYFTDHEAMDRNLISGDQSFIGWIASWFNPPGDLTTRCDDYYRRATDGSTVGRENVEASGWSCPNDRPIYNGEQIKGPFHTNDSVLVESTSGGSAPIFGQMPGDRIEIYDNGQPKTTTTCTNAQRTTGGCACPFRTGKKFLDTSISTGRTCSNIARLASGVQLVTGPEAGYIDMPAGNSELKIWAGEDAPSGSLYTGKTELTLNNNGTYTVVNSKTGASGTFSYPANGVIYVQNDVSKPIGTCESQPEFLNYNDSALPGGMKDGCALVEVKGTYNQSLTIASQADIVVTGDLTAASDTTLLGLVANNYVRVRHYAASSGDNQNYMKKCTYTFNLFDFTFPFFGFGDLASCIGVSGFGDAISFVSDAFQAVSGKPIYTCARESGSSTGTAVRNIEAAILALNRSFTVDGSQCGAQIGTSTSGLRVFGAVTQNWRGALTSQDWSAMFDSTCSYSGSNIFSQFAKAFVGVMNWCDNHHGYIYKDVSYNYRLRALSPPHFLTPKESSWLINRIRQSVPACNCGPTSTTGAD